MPTRLEIRSILRRQLTDTGTSPLWEEDFLNDAITEAIRRYGASVPRESVAAMPVAAGDREIDMPAAVNVMRVVRVFDDQGIPWRRWEELSEPPPSPTGYAEGSAGWRAWGSALILGRSAPRTGLWRVEYEANRLEPLDDLSELDISQDDDVLVLVLAFAMALQRRAVAEGKRYGKQSGAHPLAVAARTARADSDRLLWHRFRHIRSE